MQGRAETGLYAEIACSVTFFNVSAVNDDGDCLLLACQRTKWPCVDCLCPVKAGNGRLATGLGTERNGEHDDMLFCIRFRCVL